MKKIIFITASFLIFYGCATAYKMNNLSLGMTKQEAIKVMGSPESISATEGVEYLNYSLKKFSTDPFLDPYFVRIENGKVVAYGRMGDFNSTKIPVNKTIIDLNVNK